MSEDAVRYDARDGRDKRDRRDAPGFPRQAQARLAKARALMARARRLDRQALRTRAAAAGLFEAALKGWMPAQPDARRIVRDAVRFMCKAREAELGAMGVPSPSWLRPDEAARWRLERAALEFEGALEEAGVFPKARK